MRMRIALSLAAIQAAFAMQDLPLKQIREFDLSQASAVRGKNNSLELLPQTEKGLAGYHELMKMFMAIEPLAIPGVPPPVSMPILEASSSHAWKHASDCFPALVSRKQGLLAGPQTPPGLLQLMDKYINGLDATCTIAYSRVVQPLMNGQDKTTSAGDFSKIAAGCQAGADNRTGQDFISCYGFNIKPMPDILIRSMFSPLPDHNGQMQFDAQGVFLLGLRVQFQNLPPNCIVGFLDVEGDLEMSPTTHGPMKHSVSWKPTFNPMGACPGTTFDCMYPIDREDDFNRHLMIPVAWSPCENTWYIADIDIHPRIDPDGQRVHLVTADKDGIRRDHVEPKLPEKITLRLNVECTSGAKACFGVIVILLIFCCVACCCPCWKSDKDNDPAEPLIANDNVVAADNVQKDSPQDAVPVCPVVGEANV